MGGTDQRADEPRILDTDLATRLGMKNPRNIRKDLIRPNLEELRGLGGLGETTPNVGPKGGRPAKVFYLNEEQALLIAMFSRTPLAADVRREVIQVFMAYRRGQCGRSTEASSLSTPQRTQDQIKGSPEPVSWQEEFILKSCDISKELPMNTTSKLALVVTNDEPRILDTDLAVRLGLKAPRNIRTKLIQPNLEELKGLGELCIHRVQTGGRPATAYYLNEEQALLISMFSRTEMAADVRREVIQVFTAYRRGQLELSAKGKIELPNFADPGDAARAWAEMFDRNKKEAKDFQNWVTRVVLPAIRKDGGYIHGEEHVVSGAMSEDELVQFHSTQPDASRLRRFFMQRFVSPLVTRL